MYWDSNWTINELAHRLTDNWATDKEKVRSIFVWVTTHLEYDTEAARKNKIIPVLDVKPLLDRGKAICSGYAAVFSALCNEVNIPCVSVNGYTNEALRLLSVREAPDHAWNAVKLKGEWYSVDATWASSFLPAKNPGWESRYESYFLANPSIFIQSHLPADPIWQLLDRPIRYEQFQQGIYQDTTGRIFNFRDSIDAFLALSFPEQKRQAIENQYRFYPSRANGVELGHSLVDYVGRLSNRLDTLNPERDWSNILEIQADMLSKLSWAIQLVELYDWQLELYVSTLINQAVLRYNFAYEERETQLLKTKQLQLAQTDLQLAQKLLNTLPDSQYRNNALSLCANYLEVLEAMERP